MENGCAARDEISLTRELRESSDVEDIEINGTSSNKVSVRIYRQRKDAATGSNVKPAAVFFHGGGWVLGSIQTDDLFCRKIVHDLGHVVVSVEYRRAPEHPMPAAIDDCFSAVLWTAGNASKLSIDPGKIYVTGNSAGGQLAAAVALKAVQAGKASLLAGQVLRIPLTCHPDEYPGTLPDREKVPVYNDSAVVEMLSAYRASPLVSPLLADPADISKLPPAYIDVCSEDPLAPGGIAYARLLEDNGVPVRLFILEGMPHGSFILFPDLESSKVAHAACMRGTQWVLSHKQ
ncbi:hypothetical protein K491DRAFT_726085 [Lophiostoma macrostomum CBS 122681]|uniref:Alpha/beta hydrolase fold-3 domain-containing protein n=1 Tax=Lophiostoma macrostomum CBS 122681 TaxID=1314788 RepID=A0A6A6SYD8_9PLEO|nr:hypothetical protein K491DRAFT_726085 [Lophiostoma macrostomum CBS 122681]